MSSIGENFSDASRKNWFNPYQNNPTNDQLIIGCLQRIADATELMAGSYSDLIRQRDFYESKSDSLQKENERLARSIASYRGIVRKMKGKKK
jgi:hypothetical protein